MHNLHLVTIRADTPKAACQEVENEITEWGNENNWRTICGCVSADNEIYLHDKEYGRFHPEAGMTIADIKKMVKSWALTFGYDIIPVLLKFKIEEDSLQAHDWWQLKEYCRFRSEKEYFTASKFNIWETEYRSWELDQNGLTNMIEHREGKKKFVVFVDMHS